MTAAPNPFDVERLRANPPTVAAAEHVIVSVAARRPNRREFFRVHPDPQFTIDGTIIEHEDAGGKETYWVTAEMREAAPEETRVVRLFTCLSKQGVIFLWPARLPSGDNPFGRSWHESALTIAEMAQTHWTKMIANKEAGRYEAFRARGDLGEPQWPESGLEDLLRLAFPHERVIDRLDHAVLRSLRGEV